MVTDVAAGPKAGLVSSRLQRLIEDQVEVLTLGISQCLENAQAKPTSSFDDTRSSERRDATGMVSSTAQLLTAIAKMRGEFTHNYEINRVQPPTRPIIYSEEKLDGDWIAMLTQDEIDALSEAEYQNYVRQMTPPPQSRGSNGNAPKP